MAPPPQGPNAVLYPVVDTDASAESDSDFEQDPGVRATPAHCALAFRTLQRKLGLSLDEASISASASASDASESEWSDAAEAEPDSEKDAGVFVTWNVRSSRDDGPWSLRGCIGTLTPTRVPSAISQYAALAALRDRRFDPITSADFSRLQVGVSLLSRFEPASGGVYDWDIGVHGIILELREPTGRRHSATYLPEVCAEQGWNHEECIQSLLRKAGFTGRVTQQVLERATVTRYQSSKASMTYLEFLAFERRT